MQRQQCKPCQVQCYLHLWWYFLRTGHWFQFYVTHLFLPNPKLQFWTLPTNGQKLFCLKFDLNKLNVQPNQAQLLRLDIFATSKQWTWSPLSWTARAVPLPPRDKQGSLSLHSTSPTSRPLESKMLTFPLDELEASWILAPKTFFVWVCKNHETQQRYCLTLTAKYPKLKTGQYHSALKEPAIVGLLVGLSLPAEEEPLSSFLFLLPVSGGGLD